MQKRLFKIVCKTKFILSKLLPNADLRLWPRSWNWYLKVEKHLRLYLENRSRRAILNIDIYFNVGWLIGVFYRVFKNF